MACIRSLGVHTPSALSYLIAEKILPEDAKEDQYIWETYPQTAHESNATGKEEVLYTDECVVYSQGTIIRKVFRFGAEEQKVQQALLTYFVQHKGSNDDKGLERSFTHDRSVPRASGGPPLESGFGFSHQGPDETTRSRVSNGELRRALVVILKFQAHIFFISGSSHVINLPFEVERVFPAQRGIVLQRKVSKTENIAPTPIIPPPPNNSFLSSQSSALHWSQTRRSGHTSSQIKPKDQPLTIRLHEELLKIAEPEASDALPWLYSCTDPLSEMGLVVVAPTSKSQFLNVPQQRTAYESLEKVEELLYISPVNEVSEYPGDNPFILMVTGNFSTRRYSLYQATYVDETPMSDRSRAVNGHGPSQLSRRRSSYNPATGTGATTPAARSIRESFGGPGRGKAVSGSYNAQGNQMMQDKAAQNAEDAFVSQLDPDYGLPKGPNKESRRVSSLLSRTDLSASFDRSAFQDLATGVGHNSGNAAYASFNRRGQSLGGASNRASFGGSSYIRTRLSSPVSTSRLSVGIESVDETLDEITINGDSNDEDDLTFSLESKPIYGLHKISEGLRKELILTKFDEISMHKRAGNTTDDTFNTSAGFVEENFQKVKVFTTVSATEDLDPRWPGRRLCIYILERFDGHHVSLEYTLEKTSTISKTSQKSRILPITHLTPSRIQMRRANGVGDISRIIDGKTSNYLILRDGGGSLEVSLQSSNTQELCRIITVKSFKQFNSLDLGPNISTARRGIGLNRILEPSKSLCNFGHLGDAGEFDICDVDGQKYRLQVLLKPRNETICHILDVCRFVLPTTAGEALRNLWWTAMDEIYTEGNTDREWTALVVAIFIIAVQLSPVEPDQLARSLTREVSGRRQSRSYSVRRGSVKKDLNNPWEALWNSEKEGSDWKRWKGCSWDWIDKKMNSEEPANSNGLLISAQKYEESIPNPSSMKNKFIIDSLSSAIRISKLPHAKVAASYVVDTEGQKGINLVKLVIALHLLREEQKLNIVDQEGIGHERDLGPLLAQLSGWLGWNSWSWKSGDYFDLEKAGENSYYFEQSSMLQAAVPQQPWPRPPSVVEWIGNSLSVVALPSFPTLMIFVDDRQGSPNYAIYREKCQGQVAKLTPRTIALIRYIDEITKANIDPTGKVEKMAQCGITYDMMETFPEAVLINLRQAITKCQINPPATWNDLLLKLVDREDMVLGREALQNSWQDNYITGHQNHASHDIRTICQSTEYPELSNAIEGDRSAITRLIFAEDRRFVEASRLLQPLRPAVATCPPDPNWSEAEYLDAQKEVMQWVMVRTFSLPVGQAMINVDNKRPLLTEKFPLHGFTTICLMKPMNNTVSADRSSFTEEKYCWAFFHAGVSAGLSISRDAKGIDTSWIMFNKPVELSNKHAGLLLALGLNGYLKSIAKWLAFKYLTPKHTMTSIGLLLGLSASYFGTMDTLITRLLSVHITRMLPVGAAELNLSPLTQTTGLMGIGLLYANSQHRRMSEVMLAELEDVAIEDPLNTPDQLRDEGYRLAAGFALGFINLAKGDDLRGLHDMHLVERLLAVAVGPRPVNLVHILDQATAGATIAIALIFMKTENEAVARKVNVPDTLYQFDYVRPDIFLTRTLARNLIMWKEIQANDAWILQNVPLEFKRYYRLRSIKKLRSTLMPFYNILGGLLWSVGLKYAGTGDRKVRDFLLKYLDQLIRLSSYSAVKYDTRLARNTIRKCQDLVSLSVATVMAGTGDLDVFRRLRFLHGRVSPEIPYGSHMAAHMALGALFLGGGTYTFDSTPLAIASLICAFYPLFPTNVLDNKAHLQAFRHFWVLAASPRCLVVRDVETGRAIPSPVSVKLKNGSTLHRTAPCLLPDLDTIRFLRTGSPDHWPVTLDFQANPKHAVAFRHNHTITVRRRPARAAYSSAFAAALAAKADRDLRTTSTNGMSGTYAGISASPSSTLVPASSSTAGVVGNSSIGSSINGGSGWDWFTRLATFSGLDAADWALVLPPSIAGAAATSGTGAATVAPHHDHHNHTLTTMATDMEPSVVDYRLALQRTVAKSWDRNELLWLKALFEWTEADMDGKVGGREKRGDGHENGNGNGREDGEDASVDGGNQKWIGDEVIMGWRAVVGERAGRM